MIRTLKLCKVFVVVNGEVTDGGKPLTLPDIKPMEGAEAPRVIVVPPKLRDPLSGEQVSTTDDGKLKAGTLTLRTSNVSMRWSRKGRHTIIYPRHNNPEPRSRKLPGSGVVGDRP